MRFPKKETKVLKWSEASHMRYRQSLKQQIMKNSPPGSTSRVWVKKSKQLLRPESTDIGKCKITRYPQKQILMLTNMFNQNV